MTPLTQGNALVRMACATCGAEWVAQYGHTCEHSDDEKPILREYVAVDALLSDEATDAGLRALEALPAGVDGDHLRILNTALQAAVDAVTGNQEASS